MFIWALLSLTGIGLMAIAAMVYAIRFHFLLRETHCDPDLHRQLGSPSSIFDYSQDHNVRCYNAINKYFAEHRYREIADDRLRQRFVSHLTWKRRGRVAALAVIINMAACIITMVSG